MPWLYYDMFMVDEEPYEFRDIEIKNLPKKSAIKFLESFDPKKEFVNV